MSLRRTKEPAAEPTPPPAPAPEPGGLQSVGHRARVAALNSAHDDIRSAANRRLNELSLESARVQREAEEAHRRLDAEFEAIQRARAKAFVADVMTQLAPLVEAWRKSANRGVSMDIAATIVALLAREEQELNADPINAGSRVAFALEYLFGSAAVARSPAAAAPLMQRPELIMSHAVNICRASTKYGIAGVELALRHLENELDQIAGAHFGHEAPAWMSARWAAFGTQCRLELAACDERRRAAEQAASAPIAAANAERRRLEFGHRG